MSDTAWKRAEREVAKRVGGTRTPLSGSSRLLTSSDVIHPRLYVEVKRRKRYAILTLMEQVEAKAAKEKKIPVLALQLWHKKTRYYLVREQDFLDTFLTVADLQVIGVHFPKK